MKARGAGTPGAWEEGGGMRSTRSAGAPEEPGPTMPHASRSPRFRTSRKEGEMFSNQPAAGGPGQRLAV